MMPRHNPGPQIKFLPQRGKYYIVWYELGMKQVRSTGTADPVEAARIFEEAIGQEPEPLPPRAPQFIYFVGSEAGPIKIGIATNVQSRLAALQTGSPVRLSLLASVEGDLSREYLYHSIFHKHRLHGEWFEPAQPILDEIAAIGARYAA